MTKITLITGASRGLGRNTALSIARAGGDVIVTYHSRSGDARRSRFSSIPGPSRASATSLAGCLLHFVTTGSGTRSTISSTMRVMASTR